ncbi:hypothetical protein HHK36_009583 [Tetracentron sinense]|uniref:NAC domain-containing protein n=1 Tax=Tetracentron sinense TaxID=13715 RepID=A0A834ZFV1_TETSI|nr:hypothetical protein HHK36_009583 [Tetracentron sinense]
MSISVNGESRVPPGFRFHPTEEELLHYYLRKKVADEKIDLDVIRDIDLNKLEPWDIQEVCKVGSTPQNEWYFFSHKDKKYPTGRRTNRATAGGFWKATGRDKIIYSSFRQIGMRKTLVFYTGRAPHGQKSAWIMYEYRLDDSTTNTNTNTFDSMEEMTYEDGWVVCCIFKKKNQQKTVDSANSSTITTETKTQMLHSGKDDGGLEEILQYMGRTCNQENGKSNGLHQRFMQSPRQESPTLESLVNNGMLFDQVCEIQSCYGAMDVEMLMDTETSVIDQGSGNKNPVYDTDWASLDQFVASHLNCQAETFKQQACFDNTNMNFWTFTHSSPSGP